jgi:hypothetical protein
MNELDQLLAMLSNGRGILGNMPDGLNAKGGLLAHALRYGTDANQSQSAANPQNYTGASSATSVYLPTVPHMFGGSQPQTYTNILAFGATPSDYFASMSPNDQLYEALRSGQRDFDSQVSNGVDNTSTISPWLTQAYNDIGTRSNTGLRQQTGSHGDTSLLRDPPNAIDIDRYNDALGLAPHAQQTLETIASTARPNPFAKDPDASPTDTSETYGNYTSGLLDGTQSAAAGLDATLANPLLDFAPTLVTDSGLTANREIQSEPKVVNTVTSKNTLNSKDITLKFPISPYEVIKDPAWDPSIRKQKPEERDLREMVARVSEETGLDQWLIKRMIEVESSFASKAIQNRSKASGLMQLAPGTARAMGVTDFRNPEQNVRAGIRYLKEQLNKYEGHLPTALVAYNWGPGNVSRYGIHRAPAESRNYVYKIIGQKLPTRAGTK